VTPLIATLRRLLPSLSFLLACRGGAPDFPKTPLGRVGRDWLAAQTAPRGTRPYTSRW